MQPESGAWSPYLVGTLSVLTAYARLASMVGNLFSKGHTESLKFYQDTKPKIEWGVMLVFGMLLCANGW